MESISTSITASTAQQVRKPSLLDRLFFSGWYLEARELADQFAAHNATLVQRLDELVSSQRRDGGAL
jgi:hypothetical protein